MNTTQRRTYALLVALSVLLLSACHVEHGCGRPPQDCHEAIPGDPGACRRNVVGQTTNGCEDDCPTGSLPWSACSFASGCGLPPRDCYRVVPEDPGVCVRDVVGRTTDGCTDDCPEGTRTELACRLVDDADAGGPDADVPEGDAGAGLDAGLGLDAAVPLDGAAPDPDYAGCVARCERSNECGTGAALPCLEVCVGYGEDIGRPLLTAAGCVPELEAFLACLDRVTCTPESCSPSAMQACLADFCEANPSDPVCA